MLAGIQNGVDAVKNSVEVPQKLNIDFPCDPEIGRRPKGPKAGAPIDPRAPLRMEGFLMTAKAGAPQMCVRRGWVTCAWGVHTAAVTQRRGGRGFSYMTNTGGPGNMMPSA